ncbi:MAG: response regulator transcription factor [Syntrophomonadaceae bacterium]|nr:response regulator transcription factor [Syntrophomonadaceae bacterium]
MQKIRLLVMCELQGVRRGLAAIFASEICFEVVHVAECNVDSIAYAQKIQPDAILCEFKSGEESILFIKQIKEACPYTKVFVFMNNENSEEARKAISAGVDGCLARSMLPCHLVKAVELGCRTGVICFPGSLKQLVDSQDEPTVSVKDKLGPPYSEGVNESNSTSLLTPREKEIYKLVTQNYSNKEIGSKLFISQPTVKSHVSSILRKLGLSNRTQLILYEIQNNGGITKQFSGNDDFHINS